MVRQVTVTYVFNKNKILLGFCKKGMSAGKYNGFGGHKKETETIEEAALRELREESGIKAKKTRKLGALRIINDIEGEIELHVFKVVEYEGEPIETDEMKPEWFEVTKLPYEKMWPNDKFQIPFVIKDLPFEGFFELSGDSKITRYNISKEKDLCEQSNRLS